MSPLLPRHEGPSPPAAANAGPAGRGPSNGGVSNDERELGLESVDLRETLAVLKRHRWLILSATAVTVGIAAYMAYTQQPLYRARAVIRVANARQAVTGGLEDKTQESPFGWNADPLVSQLEILKSRGVAAEVVDREPLPLRLQPHGFPVALLKDVQLLPTAAPETLFLHFGSR